MLAVTVTATLYEAKRECSINVFSGPSVVTYRSWSTLTPWKKILTTVMVLHVFNIIVSTQSQIFSSYQPRRICELAFGPIPSPAPASSNWEADVSTLCRTSQAQMFRYTAQVCGLVKEFLKGGSGVVQNAHVTWAKWSSVHFTRFDRWHTCRFYICLE